MYTLEGIRQRCREQGTPIGIHGLRYHTKAGGRLTPFNRIAGKRPALLLFRDEEVERFLAWMRRRKGM